MPNPNLSQVKQISSCQQAKYDRAISLKAAAESAPPYRPLDTDQAQGLVADKELTQSPVGFNPITSWFLFSLTPSHASFVICYFVQN